MNLRVFVLVIAAIAALAVVVVVSKTMKPKPAPAAAQAVVAAPPPKPMTRVLVAKHDLQTGLVLSEADVAWQAWPNEGLNPAFVTGGAVPQSGTLDQVAKAASDLVDKNSLKDLTGATVRNPIMTGEPILARKLVRAGESGYLAVVLTPGMVAVSTPITVETGVAGFVVPGDRVDVLQSRAVPNQNANGGGDRNKFQVQTVLRNIKVLAVDQKVDAPTDSKTLLATTATLEVSPIAAEVLAKAKAEGSLSLALRSYADTGGPSGVAAPTSPERVVTVYKGGEATSFAVAP